MVRAPRSGRIDVYTARGARHYVFSETGELLSASTYPPKDYSSFADPAAESLLVPTPFWLWPFTHPLCSWLLAMVGIATISVIEKGARKTRRAT